MRKKMFIVISILCLCCANTSHAGWFKISPKDNTEVYSIAIDSKNTQTIYFGVGDGIFKSINGGQTWNKLDILLHSPCVVVDKSNTQIIYAVSGTDLFKSVDGGRNWDLIYTTIDLPLYNITVDPANSNNLYVCGRWGIYKSIDGGLSWNTVRSYPSDYMNIVIDVNDSNKLYVATRMSPEGVLKSNDGGNSWIKSNNGLPNPMAIRCIAVDPIRPATIYVGLETRSYNVDSVIYRITNSGLSWNKMTTPSDAVMVHSISVNPKNSQTIYALAVYPAIATPWKLTIIRSINGGTSWDQFYSVGLRDTDIESLIIDPHSTRVLYAGSSSFGAFKYTIVPEAPRGVTATVGDKRATVKFNPPIPNGTSPITSYIATSSPGGITNTGKASPIPVTGLTNGTNYTFTVKATNIKGTGPASNLSNKVMVGTPNPPTGVTATAGNAQATVSFRPPISNGTSPMTGYIVTSYPSGITKTGTKSPITVTGLTNGTAYKFKVQAKNAVGTGAASALSNVVVPSP